MSSEVNTNILERAACLLDEIDSHPSGYDHLLEQAIDHNDIDEVQRLVSIIEGNLSIEHFKGREIITW